MPQNYGTMKFITLRPLANFRYAIILDTQIYPNFFSFLVTLNIIYKCVKMAYFNTRPKKGKIYKVSKKLFASF